MDRLIVWMDAKSYGQMDAQWIDTSDMSLWNYIIHTYMFTVFELVSGTYLIIL